MLTKEQSIVQYDFQRQVVMPDRLHRRTHGHYLPLADELLQLYRDHVGEVRKSLHDRVRRRMQDIGDCPSRRIGAFCKLLDDASEYQRDKSGTAARLRKRVFSLAAPQHPLVQQSDQLFDHEETAVKRKIAAELSADWSDIEANLFADVIEFHRLLKTADEIDGARLLSRYNLAQTQAALYCATSMTLWGKQDFKSILRYAKLARLMHSITQQGDRYTFQFDGPVSVIRGTKRYGVAFARFLPGLLSARDWRMQATILGPGQRPFVLRLSDRDGLSSEVKPEEFDSQLEESFANAWRDAETGGWSLRREATILHQGQTVFMPDFTLTHQGHGEVQLEIIGFWTPEYLREKVLRLERFRGQARILLAIADTVQHSIPDLGIARLTFKSTLRPKHVLEQLERMTATTSP